MIRVTIIEPIDMAAHLTSETSPIWQDKNGVRFRVASGLTETPPESAWWPLHGPLPALEGQTPVVIAGMDGLDALSALGLVRVLHNPAG